MTCITTLALAHNGCHALVAIRTAIAVAVGGSIAKTIACSCVLASFTLGQMQTVFGSSCSHAKPSRVHQQGCARHCDVATYGEQSMYMDVPYSLIS